MTIQQAIERAKQLRKERSSREDSPAKAAPGVDAAAPRRRALDATVPDQVRTLTFPLIVPDARSCQLNRVLIAEERNEQTAKAHDAYRIIRTQLKQRSAAQNWKRFGVTSPGPGEGKSTTALNLALALAREGRENVFLVDLDLRNPSIAEYLGISMPTEIGQFFTGSRVASEVFFSIGVERLAVAAGLTRYDNSSELLSGPKLSELFNYIADQDPGAWVLIDLPPLLATADALVVAPKLSATVVVVAEGRTRRDELRRATEVLGKADIAGIVLNRSKHANDSYYGYY